MTDYNNSSTSIALDMAARKSKLRKKGSKALRILTVLSFGMAFAIAAPTIAYAAFSDDAVQFAETLSAGQTYSEETASLASEASALTEEYEALCQTPALAEAEALTAGTGSGEAFDSITDACTNFAVENADFVEKVEAATSIWTNIGDGFGEVTDTVKAAMEAGDVATAIRILFAQSEEAGA